MTANNQPPGPQQANSPHASVGDTAPGKGDTFVLPVVQEQIHVSKREVDSGRGVRLHRHTVERTEIVDEPLRDEFVEVVRVPVGTMVDSAALPVPRQEGDTFIVPVLEEVMVVERRLRLKEEVRITRHQREKHAPQSVVVKSYEVQVERFDEKRDIGATPPGTPSSSRNPKRDDNSPGDLAG